MGNHIYGSTPSSTTSAGASGNGNAATGPAAAPPAAGPIQRKYGWKRGLHSINDQHRRFTMKAGIPLPTRADLRAGCPPVDDQGDLGSCVGHAVTAAVDYVLLQVAQEQPVGGEIIPAPESKGAVDTTVRSRLFTYYNARSYDGTVSVDVGTSIHSGVRAVVEIGSCPEPLWPYVPSKFATKPSIESYDAAKKTLIRNAEWLLQDLNQLRAALAAGNTVSCGIVVYQSFESSGSALTGVVGVPQKGESMLGGHAILLVGYDDTQRWFIFRNSWGASWGDKGYGYIPYNYIVNPDLAAEFAIVTGLRDEVSR